MNFITRIQKVTIRNLKNVGFGEIRFTCNTKEDIFEAGSDILGMYGQNGSGKTTLIFALEILSQLTSGKKLWKDANKFIKIGASDATVCYEFSVGYESGDKFYVRYEVTLKEKLKEEQMEEVTEQSPESVVYVEKEKLSYRKINGNKGNRFISIIDYDFHKDTIFEPDTRFREFISNDKQLTDELRYMKVVSYKEGLSYIFTIGRINNIRDRQGFSDEMISIMDAIHMFGMMKLFVLSNVQASIVNANIVLPMIFHFIDNDKKVYRTIVVRIKLTDETLVPQKIYNLM
ncbi:MAG: ATP-binding protein, partial [Acetatifactor sp.]|nr:ATP-binding protein [Acetatifactor sp.]